MGQRLAFTLARLYRIDRTIFSRQLLPAPYYLLHASNAKFKTQYCLWFYFCLRMHKFGCEFYTLWISKYGRSFLYFILTSGWSYPEVSYEFQISISRMCDVNGVEDWDLELIYVCLWILTSESHLCCSSKFLDCDIWKWHISFGFVYPKLYNLTYEYEYPKYKNFKSLRTKRTFHVNVLGQGE